MSAREPNKWTITIVRKYHVETVTAREAVKKCLNDEVKPFDTETKWERADDNGNE